MIELNAIDFAIIACLMFCSMAIGICCAWKGRKDNNEEFLMGGRKMSVFPVCISYIASIINPTTLLGYPAEVYSKGPNLICFLFAQVIAYVIAAEVFIPIYYKIQLTSVNTYLIKRYKSEPLRKLASFSISVSYIPWLGVVLYTPSLVLSTGTGISVGGCILIIGICVTIYTAIGGLKAVIWTDVFQSTFMVVGMVAVVVMGANNVGSFDEIWRRAYEGGRLTFNTDFDIYSSGNIWMVSIGFMFHWIAGNAVEQMLIQRTCSLPTLRKAKQFVFFKDKIIYLKFIQRKRVVYFSIPGSAFFHIIEVLLGLIIYSNYYKCDPVLSGKIGRIDEIVPLFVQETFSGIPGLTGLFVACILSASLSTLSSGINAISALIWEDLFSTRLQNVKPFLAVLYTKLIAACLGCICILMAYVSSRFDSVIEATFALSAAPIASLFAVFFMGVMLPFVNVKGAVVALISGLSVSFLVSYGSLVYRPPNRALLSSSEGCNISIHGNPTFSVVPFSDLRDNRIPEYHPQGWDHLFHISFFMRSIFGFTFALIFGVIVSLLTGNKEYEKINPNLLNGFVVKIMKKKFSQENCITLPLRQEDIEETKA